MSEQHERTLRIQELKRLVASAQYVIDAGLVAEAVLRRSGLADDLLLGVSPRGARSREAF